MKKTVLAFATGVVAFGLLFVAWVYPEVPSATYTFAALLLALLGVMAWMNQRALKEAMKTRSLRYGTNAAVTVALVVAILVVINFLNYNHYWRKDLTKDKVHSLSDQTVKIVKGLKDPVKLTVFVKTAERDAAKGVIENYLYHTDKLLVEYVDPDRDPTRAKAANVKKYGTVIVASGTRDTRVEEINEEKLTNAILKVLKDKAVMVCFMTGHGERGIQGETPEAYSQTKNELASQNYEAKEFNLLQEGKIPEDCTVVAVMGPNKAFFAKELEIIGKYLAGGGRAIFGLDPNIKGGADYNKELKTLLSGWYIEYKHNLVLDPTSRLLGVNASVPIVGMYSKDHPITKEFEVTTLFPLASSVEPKAGAPSSLKVIWLAKSTPQAFAKSDFKEIATGKVKIDPKTDAAGPHTLMVAAEGSKDKGAKPAKIIALGTSQLAANQYAGHGANLDLFLNSVSWLADDENLISIRPKEESSQIPALSQTEGRYIQLVTMILVPGLVLLFGLFMWMKRRRL